MPSMGFQWAKGSLTRRRRGSDHARVPRDVHTLEFLLNPKPTTHHHHRVTTVNEPQLPSE
jgi:hypothetical protein